MLSSSNSTELEFSPVVPSPNPSSLTLTFCSSSHLFQILCFLVPLHLSVLQLPPPPPPPLSLSSPLSFISQRSVITCRPSCLATHTHTHTFVQVAVWRWLMRCWFRHVGVNRLAPWLDSMSAHAHTYSHTRTAAMKSRKWRKKDFGNRGENKKETLNHDKTKRRVGRRVRRW